MILGHNEIHNRISKGQVFRKGTSDPSCVKEASYALRAASDGLILEGEPFKPDERHVEGKIVIKPGKIAILSTLERLNMPGDLVGKIGIRFKYASQGLIGLMGIQVDPNYGRNHVDERLYIRVANIGNDDISIPVHDEVFTFELQSLLGYVPPRHEPRVPMWLRLQETLAQRTFSSDSYITQVNTDLMDLSRQLESDIRSIRDYLQPLVMFGIFLIAVTILGVALTVIVTGSDTPEIYVPTWVRDWGWKVLLGTLSSAAIATGLIGCITVAAIAYRTLKRQ